MRSDAVLGAKTARTLPHATDRYARLLIAQLSDSDPKPREQEIVCELGRLGHGLGDREALRRVKAVKDSVYRTPEAKRRRHEIERRRTGIRTRSVDRCATRSTPWEIASRRCSADSRWSAIQH